MSFAGTKLFTALQSMADLWSSRSIASAISRKPIYTDTASTFPMKRACFTLTATSGYIPRILRNTALSRLNNNLNFFGEGNKSVNNYVMVFNNHAVNAYRISKILSNEVIYYHDFSSTGTGSGFILGMEMEGIFVFD